MMTLMSALRGLWNTEGRSDRLDYITVAGSAIGVLVVGGLSFEMIYPERPDALGLMIGLPVLFLMAAILLLASARRIHDFNRSALWIFGFGLLVRLVRFGALLIGLEPFSDEIGLGMMALGVAYLALTPGSLGPNNFGPEPAMVSGPQIALPAVALFKPGARLGIPIPEIFNLCASPSHLQIVIAQSYASLGEAIFVDSEGAAFRGSGTSADGGRNTNSPA